MMNIPEAGKQSVLTYYYSDGSEPKGSTLQIGGKDVICSAIQASPDKTDTPRVY